MIAIIVAVLMTTLARLGSIPSLFSESAIFAIVYYALPAADKHLVRSSKHYEDLSSPLSQPKEMGLSFVIGLIVDVVSDSPIGLRGLYYTLAFTILRRIAQNFGLRNPIAQVMACASVHTILAIFLTAAAYQISGVVGVPNISLSIFLNALLCPVIIYIVARMSNTINVPSQRVHGHRRRRRLRWG